MKVKTYSTLERLQRDVFNDYNFGEKLYFSKVGENAMFFVVESYTFGNGNRMTISVVIEYYEDHQIIHYVTGGSSQGIFFRFDWGAGKRRENKLLNILDSLGVKYDVLND